MIRNALVNASRRQATCTTAHRQCRQCGLVRIATFRVGLWIDGSAQIRPRTECRAGSFQDALCGIIIMKIGPACHAKKMAEPHQCWQPQTWCCRKYSEISKEYGDTYRYIQFDVSRLGLPVNHSGAKVIQPGEGQTTCQPENNSQCQRSITPSTTPVGPTSSSPNFICTPNNACAPLTLSGAYEKGTHLHIFPQ